MKVYIDGKKFWEIYGIPDGNPSLVALQNYSVLVASAPPAVVIVENYVEPPPPDPGP